MFIFRINSYFIILFLTLLFINSCNYSSTTNSKIIIDNTMSKPILSNKNIIVNKINKEKNSKILNEKNNIKQKYIFVPNDKSKITKKKINLLDGIATNVINENDVVFEFRNDSIDIIN